MKKRTKIARIDEDFYSYLEDLAKKEDMTLTSITRELHKKLTNKRIRMEL